MMDSEFELVPVGEDEKKFSSIRDLIPDDFNPNQGSPRGSWMLEESMRNLGSGRSIVVDKNGKVIAGNKSLQAARDAGLDEEILVVRSQGHQLLVHVREDLDLDNDPLARELSIADNRCAEVGITWDKEVLKQIKENAQEVKVEQYFHEEELNKIIGLATQSGTSGNSNTGTPTVISTPLTHCPACGTILIGLENTNGE